MKLDMNSDMVTPEVKRKVLDKLSKNIVATTTQTQIEVMSQRKDNDPDNELYRKPPRVRRSRSMSSPTYPTVPGVSIAGLHADGKILTNGSRRTRRGNTIHRVAQHGVWITPTARRTAR